jgi:hypothetical protein
MKLPLAGGRKALELGVSTDFGVTSSSEKLPTTTQLSPYARGEHRTLDLSVTRPHSNTPTSLNSRKLSGHYFKSNRLKLFVFELLNRFDRESLSHQSTGISRGNSARHEIEDFLITYT